MALALAGVVIVGAILLYQSVMKSNARAELVQLSRELRGGVDRAWTGLGTYEGVTMERLCEFGIVPAKNMTRPDDCDHTRFHTPMSDFGASDSIGVWPLVLSGSTPKGFQLAFRRLGDEDCKELLRGWAGQTDNRSAFLGAEVISMGPGSWSPRPFADFRPSPLTLAGIELECDHGENANQVYLAFR